MRIKIDELSFGVIAQRLRAAVNDDAIEVQPDEVKTGTLQRWLIEQLGAICARCKTREDLMIHHVLGGGTILRERFGYRGELLRIIADLPSNKYIVSCLRWDAALE